MPIFETMIIVHPTKNQRKDGTLEEVLVAPHVAAASDVESAKRQALIANHSAIIAHEDDGIDRLEVLVRPFA